MAKNYIEHEISVRFMEQYYSKGTEWQWFIDIIEEAYEFVDINEWKGYIDSCWRYGQLYSYLEKIVEVGREDLNISNLIFSEYSRAVTPQIRQAGNRLSGLAETACASLLA